MLYLLLVFFSGLAARVWQPGWTHAPLILTGLMWAWLGWRAASALIHMQRAEHPVLQIPRALVYVVLSGAGIVYAPLSLWLFTGAGWAYGRQVAGTWTGKILGQYAHIVFHNSPGWYQVSILHPWRVSYFLSGVALLAIVVGIATAMLWPKRYGWEHWFIVRLAHVLHAPEPHGDHHLRGSRRVDRRH